MKLQLTSRGKILKVTKSSTRRLPLFIVADLRHVTYACINQTRVAASYDYYLRYPG